MEKIKQRFHQREATIRNEFGMLENFQMDLLLTSLELPTGCLAKYGFVRRQARRPLITSFILWLKYTELLHLFEYLIVENSSKCFLVFFIIYNRQQISFFFSVLTIKTGHNL